MLLSCFLKTRMGENTRIAFVYSTPIEVCHPCRARSHKVFGDLPQWGKNSIGWYYGFKLHLIINDRGELLAFKLTAANTDDRKHLPDLTQGLIGKLFGDKGYVSQSLFEELYQRGLQLIDRCRKNLKNRLMPLIDRIMLRKRAIIESVNHQLKNICQIQHTRHRSVWNFLVNLLGGLIAYTYHPVKPSLDLEVKGLPALPPAVF
ncbi:IS982 family transposase [Moorena sp. SIO4G3]|uniref:IS982 family transposase n=1 Tax=Moorena sp. SIO4G3 TaxID=2607821 RepID=UPI0025E9F96B|nr:IS982 family transposase [Moorena sp. SIO4G3]